MTFKFKYLLAAMLAWSVPSVCIAQALAGSDVDADASSDFSLISIQGDSSLSWSSYSSSGVLIDGSQVLLGQAGNHIILGNWSSVSRAQRGILSLDGQKVLWTIVPQGGSPVSKYLGAQKDTLLSGADFNNNGFADAAFIRKPREGEVQLNWRIRYDFFREADGGRPGPNGVKKFVFGKVGETAFFANVEGRGDWLGILGVNPNGFGSQLSFFNPKTGKQKKFKVPSFTEGNIRPLPLRQATGGDLIALARRESGDTAVKFVNMRGQIISEATLAGTGELIVGDFLPASGQEIAIELDGGGFLVHNPVTSEESSVSVPDGIVVDDVNINSFDPNPEDPSCEDEVRDPRDGTDKFLWKPKGENSGLLRVLWPQEFTGKIVEVVILDPQGNFVERAAISYDSSNPNARTFAIFKKPGGRYPAGLTVRARLRAGCYKSYVIDTPAERVD